MPWQRLGMAPAPGTPLCSILPSHCVPIRNTWSWTAAGTTDPQRWGQTLGAEGGRAAHTSNTPGFWNSSASVNPDIFLTCKLGSPQSRCLYSGTKLFRIWYQLSPWWYSRVLLKDDLYIRYLILLQRRADCLMTAPLRRVKGTQDLSFDFSSDTLWLCDLSPSLYFRFFPLIKLGGKTYKIQP